MFNFTIIIPHKNIPNLLQRCLDSIPIRDDLQIIIVDDNSDPNIVNFKNFPGSKRTNTEVIFTKEGRGAGYARNIGLKHAKGEWILFADSDDFFASDLFNKIDFYVESNFDLILFKSKCVLSSDISKEGSRSKLCKSISAKIDLFRNGKYDFRTLLAECEVPWGKLVKRNFLLKNNIKFAETQYANDSEWSAYLAVKIDEIHFNADSNTLYYLTDHNNSLTSTDTFNSLLCRHAVSLRRKDILRTKTIECMSKYYYIDFVLRARSLGIVSLHRFIKQLIKMEKSIPPIYNIEKRLNFRYPYLFFLVQHIRALFDFIIK